MLRSPSTIPVRLAWAGLLLGAACLVALLVRFWGTRPEYADRFLILLGAIWVAWQHRTAVPAGRPQAWLAFAPALAVALLFPIAAFLQTQAAGGRTVLLWLDAAALVLGASALLLAGGGWPRLRHFGFPLVFPFLALPLPSRVLDPLQRQLQEATTTFAAGAFPWVGLPVERSGFVLKLAGGDLGVAEACSGVQSLTALTALAAFLAYRKGFGPCRGAVLTLLAVPVVVAVNALRVVLSGLIQEHAGRSYIQGDWHDGLGLALVLVGLAAILGIAALLGHSSWVIRHSTLRTEAAPQAPHWAAAVVALLILGGVAAGGWTYFHGSSRAEAVERDAPLERLPLRIGGWRGEDRPIPDEVPALLGQDRILHRVYEDNLGQQVTVWVIYWSSAKLVKGYHHPDVCLGNQGFDATAKWTEDLRPSGAGPLPATAREFRRGDRDTQFVLYWTQEGNRIWTEADEQAAQRETGFLTRPEWFKDALLGRTTQPAGRLVVLVGTGSSAPLAKAETLRMARDLASEVYALCPWASPAAVAHP